MANRSQNDRGPGGSQHDSSSPYKRSRPQSPTSTMTGLQRSGPAYYQDPRFGMAVAAVAAGGGFGSIYRDPFQPTHQNVEQHAPSVREQFAHDSRIAVSAQASQNAELLMHKQRRPTLLDYQTHGSHSQPGLDRSNRFRQEPPPSAYGHYRHDNMGNIQSAPQPSISNEPGPQTPKRLRLANDRPDLSQPLRIDVSQEPKREPAYNPQVEAISPTLPPEETLKVQKVKDDLLQNISKIDREIAMLEQQITMKQKKKEQQEEAANKQKEEVESDEAPEMSTVDLKHQSIAQIIYAENRKKAAESHHKFSKMGPKVDLPLYNQPSDAPVYHENKRKFTQFKPRLILHFKKRHEARRARERYLTKRYEELMQAWLKKLEKWENNVKRKQKESKTREYFEKIFPELKKARDDKDRLNRSGTRAGMPVYARSEAELEQIMDGIHEQEEEDKKMRSLAVIPPMMLDARQRAHKFINKNGLIQDCMEEYKERKYVNVWTTQEKQIFKEKYLQHPKNFGLIASFLEKKSTKDCVEYYYRSKKSENYKQMLRKQTVKKKRQQAKQQVQQPVIPKEEVIEGITAGEVTQSTSAVGIPDEAITVVTSTATSGPPLRPDSSSQAGTSKEKDEEDKDMLDDSSDDNDKGAEGEGGVHPCAACKTQLEHYGLSRPLTAKNCEQYGIMQADLTTEMRVCSSCRCKSVRRRCTLCPVPSCKTPKRKVKRLRPLPAKWAEIPAAMKEAMMKDLQLTEDINKCCSACFNRIARRLETAVQPAEPPVTTCTEEVPPENPPEVPTPMEVSEPVESSRWTEPEIELAKKALSEHGRDWAAIAAVMGTKTEAQCRNFYSNYRRKYNLEALIGEGREREEDNRTVSICESIASTVTAPSDGEQNFSENEENRDTDDSGTASAPSPRPMHVEDRDIQKDMKADMGRPGGPDMVPSEGPVSLQSQKNLSTSQGSLRSIPDNDSTATLSADEAPGGSQDKPSSVPSQQQQQQQLKHGGHMGQGGMQHQDLTEVHSSTQRLAQAGAIGVGMPVRPASSPAQSPGNSSQQNLPSRPGSRQSPASAGQQVGGYHHSRPSSRTSGHEVPIMRESNPTANVLDFSQGLKQYPQYPQGREAGLVSRGVEQGLGPRDMSPHMVLPPQSHLLLGFDPAMRATPPEKNKSNKQPTNVRDLIHSAIERNLTQNTDRPSQDRPRSTDAVYPPQNQPSQHELQPTDLRKDIQRQMYPERRSSPYTIPVRDPRDLRNDPRADPREMTGGGGGIDLSLRPPSVDKTQHQYKGDPRDFVTHVHLRKPDTYRGQDETQVHKVATMVTPPPAHSHRRSPFQVQAERQTLSPSVRGLPPSSSPYSPHSGASDSRRHPGKDVIPPPPPLITSASPRLPKSPPSGSITQGTPVGHPANNPPTSVSQGRGQPAVQRGSITQGTPIREAGMGRGMVHMEGPRAPGQYDIRMMEQQAQARSMYDQRSYELQRMHHPNYSQPPFRYGPGTSSQSEAYSTKQTIISDYATARQMRHQSSPTEKDQREMRDVRDARDVRDPRDLRDQSVSPRALDHGPGQVLKGYPPDQRMGYQMQPGRMYLQPGQGQQPPSSRVSPRPTSSMPSPRDEKTGSPWMMAQQRPNSGGGHPSPHPGEQQMGYPPQPSRGGPSITSGTGRQSVITESRNDDRYSRPDSSGSHHSPRMGQPEAYMGLTQGSQEHRRSPAVHPDYRQQQYERDMREKEAKEREYQAIHDAKAKFEQGIQEARMKQQQFQMQQQQFQHHHQQQQEAENAKVAERMKEECLQKMRNEQSNKGGSKVNHPTDLLKVFASDSQHISKQQDSGSGKNCSMTAAKLIDAIIVHQINQSTEDTSTSDTTSSQSRAMKQDPKVSSQGSMSQNQQGNQMYSQGGQGHMMGGPGYPGQMYPGQQHFQKEQGYKGESKSPPVQMGKKRWMHTQPPAQGAPGSFSPVGSTKSEPDSKPPSRPPSSGGGSVHSQSPVQDPKQMTFGDHINSIILQDYTGKKGSGGPPAGTKSFLSQINGSTTQTSAPHQKGAYSTPSTTASMPSEMSHSWTSPGQPGPGQTDGQNKASSAALLGHKKFKWRQTNEQASSSGGAGQYDPSVSQSDASSRGGEGPDWTRQMRPDQSHSPNSTAMGGPGSGQPGSPQGHADSSSGSQLGPGDKGMGKKSLQDSEVSTMEYVKNKIAQCLQEDNSNDVRKQSQHGGQAAMETQSIRQSPHSQMMPHSATKQRTQSPVSSHLSKENLHKHGRPESRQSAPVSTSADPLMGPGGRDLASVSPSSSSLPSPDQHQDDESSRGATYRGQAQSPVSSVGDSRDQVHSSQHPHRKGRVFTRPRSRMDQEEQDPRKGVSTSQREPMKSSQRVSPSASVMEGSRMPSSSDKKGPRSEYDFPDSPDEKSLGKSLSSYMALSSSTRSPRRGMVDSSENRGSSGTEGGRDGEGNVESSEDVSHSEAKVSDSSKDNEAQSFERYTADHTGEAGKVSEQGRKSDENLVTSRLGVGSSRKHSSEADEGSNISHTSADSTDRLMVDETSNIDSSSGAEVTSLSQVASGSRRSSKSSRESDNSPHCAMEYGSSSDHVSHSRQGHRSRSPRSYPQSSTELSSNMGYPRRGGDVEPGSDGRDQEPQPLLSSQYETLSDDEQA